MASNSIIEMIMAANNCSVSKAMDLLNESKEEMDDCADWNECASYVDSILNLPTDMTALFYK